MAYCPLGSACGAACKVANQRRHASRSSSGVSISTMPRARVAARTPAGPRSRRDVDVDCARRCGICAHARRCPPDAARPYCAGPGGAAAPARAPAIRDIAGQRTRRRLRRRAPARFKRAVPGAGRTVAISVAMRRATHRSCRRPPSAGRICPARVGVEIAERRGLWHSCSSAARAACLTRRDFAGVEGVRYSRAGRRPGCWSSSSQRRLCFLERARGLGLATLELGYARHRRCDRSPIGEVAVRAPLLPWSAWLPALSAGARCAPAPS